MKRICLLLLIAALLFGSVCFLRSAGAELPIRNGKITGTIESIEYLETRKIDRHNLARITVKPKGREGLDIL